MNTEEQSRYYMKRALGLAQRAWGETHPNPLVGAVIVEQGEVVAEGWHRKAGQPHAEIEALRALGRKPSKDATLYITLEPCSTQGRTGTCTRAIMESGIRHVVVGAIDPNPRHGGSGLDQLRANGIRVTEGVLADDCADLNLIFNHWIVRSKPLIAMKVALTLDGKFAAASGQSRWVTGESARADVMRWRRYFPAIAVGSNTVLIDNPSLTSRVGDTVWCPRRFVFDRTLKTVGSATLPKLYSDEHRERTTVLCSSAAEGRARNRLAEQGVSIWELPEVDKQLDLKAFRKRCADESIYGVYVEAGPGIASSLLRQGFVDYTFIYKAPKFINDSEAPAIGFSQLTQSMNEALQLKQVRHTILGEDVLIRGSFLATDMHR